MRTLTKMIPSMGLLIAMALLFTLTFSQVSDAQSIPWMFEPTNQLHSLSNNYCEIQDYGYSYYHDGIDVIKDDGGIPVYSVSDGYMTHEAYGTMYGGLMMGYSYTAGDSGWLYWHLPSSTFQFNVGDFIQEGDYIGDIAYWSVYDFNHVHFNKVDGTGGLPWGWYASTGNPMEQLIPDDDPQPPSIYNAVGNQLLAFCEDNTSNYLNPNQLLGNVDIITKIGDLCRNDYWEIIPLTIEYTIAGNGISEHQSAFHFGGDLPPDNTLFTVYKDDATCPSIGNYTDRDFYFIITNHDNDLVIEYDDRYGYWKTNGYPAGDYMITVDTYDAGGNLTQDSMQVTVLASPTYDVTVTLTPTSSTQLPSTGGSFTYTVNIQNNETSAVSFDGWLEMTYPNGDISTVAERALNVPAGGTINRELTMTVAGSEPDGSYYYEGKVGYSPYNHWQSSGFTFSKGTDGIPAGDLITETRLDGWDDLDAEINVDKQDGIDKSTTANLVIHPNPFNPVTTLSFSIASDAQIKLSVFDIAGREIATVVDARLPAGQHSATFDGHNLASGMYFYRLSIDNQVESGKLLLLK